MAHWEGAFRAVAWGHDDLTGGESSCFGFGASVIRQAIESQAGQATLVRISQTFNQLIYRQPRDFRYLRIFVVEMTIDESKQVVVHSLVNAHALGNEPVVDRAEFADHLAGHARFLPHLAFGSGVLGFIRFHVALRH